MEANLGLRILLTSSGFIYLVFLAILSGPSGASSQRVHEFRSQETNIGQVEKELNVINQTQALTVVNVESNGRNVKMNLRNDYEKTITAFAISPVNNRYLVRVDFIDSDEAIAPQAHYLKEFTLPDSKASRATIVIRSVVFEDGTSDGDVGVSRRIIDNRLGETRQMQRIVALLDNTFKSTKETLAKSVANLKANLENLPTISEQGVSVYFQGGLHSAKQNALKDIENLKHRLQQAENEDLLHGLREIKDRYERRLAKRGN